MMRQKWCIVQLKEGDIMNVELACEKAYELLRTDNLRGIYKAKDVGNSYVFYGGNPNEIYYGIRTVSVDKETGRVDWFDINANREVMKNSKDIDIPKEYMYKAS